MKDLQTYYKDVLEDIESLGIPYGEITKVSVNSRAKSRWGLCKPKKKRVYKDGENPYTFEIEISSELLADDIPDKGLKETIAHEILHTCKDCLNHGKQWKQYASLLKPFGYDIKRTNSAADKGIENRVINYRYKVVCESCGHEYFYTKATKCIKSNCRGFYCGVCKSANLKIFTI